MKKILLILTITFSFLSIAIAQDFKLEPLSPPQNITTQKHQINHAKFKNIPINGSLKSFIQKMEEDGFKLDYLFKDNASAIMKGEFTGRSATVFILSTKKGDNVWKVSVDFDTEESWISLRSDYFKYKKYFTQKYGSPSSSYEKFIKPYYEGDGYELQALKNKKCNYISFFNISNGVAAVELSNDGNVRIGYEDNYNASLRSLEKAESALEDI